MDEAEFPKIKTVDLAMKPKAIDSKLMEGEMDFSKADGKRVTAKIIEKDMRLKNAGKEEYKLKEVKNIFTGV